jgi:hypothetical protein
MLTQKADRRAYAHPKERLIGPVGKNRNRTKKCRHKNRKKGKRKCRQASVSNSTTACTIRSRGKRSSSFNPTTTSSSSSYTTTYSAIIRSRGKSAGDTRTGGA